MTNILYPVIKIPKEDEEDQNYRRPLHRLRIQDIRIGSAAHPSSHRPQEGPGRERQLQEENQRRHDLGKRGIRIVQKANRPPPKVAQMLVSSSTSCSCSGSCRIANIKHIHVRLPVNGGNFYREKETLQENVNKLQNALAVSRDKENDTCDKVKRSLDVAEQAQYEKNAAESEIRRLKDELERQHLKLRDTIAEQVSLLNFPTFRRISLVA